MTDDQTTGSCPTCARREPRTPQLCDVCRSRLRAWLFDIPDLYGQLAEGEPSVREYRGTRVLDDEERTEVPHYDHVSNVLPAGGPPAGLRNSPITGSRRPRLPINEDAADLTGPVRSAGVAVLDEDAVGHASVASVLDFWVEDWRVSRGAGEGRPPANVPALARWLLDRLDDACDSGPAIAEFFEAVRRLRGALQAQLGQVDIPDYKRGVPCPKCWALTLVHHAGSEYITCGSCPAQIKFIEYDDHVRALSAEQVLVRKAQEVKIKALQRLHDAMEAAGWTLAVRYEDAEIGDDGAPLHEGYRVHGWTRGTERVEAWAVAGDAGAAPALWYTTGEEDTLPLINVSADWVKTNGIPALTRLARAAGILTPVKQKEKAA